MGEQRKRLAQNEALDAYEVNVDEWFKDSGSVQLDSSLGPLVVEADVDLVKRKDPVKP